MCAGDQPVQSEPSEVVAGLVNGVGDAEQADTWARRLRLVKPRAFKPMQRAPSRAKRLRVSCEGDPFITRGSVAPIHDTPNHPQHLHRQSQR